MIILSLTYGGYGSVRPNFLTLPNALTLARIALSPLIFKALITGNYERTLWFFLLASATDLADGWLARRLKQESRWGVYLDPIADKLLLAMVWWGFMAQGWMPQSAGFLLILREVVIVAGSFLLRGRGIQVRPLQAGKVNTLIQIMFIMVTLLLFQGYSPLAPYWLRYGLMIIFVSALYSGYLYAVLWWRHRSG